LERGEKSLVTLDATIESADEKYFIKINVEDGAIRIPLSEDSPNEIKSAFNKIIKRVRLGEITIKLDKIGDDLFSMVANEYLTLLNREIQEVRSQMIEFDLVKPAAPH
jgi:hypothetical protein